MAKFTNVAPSLFSLLEIGFLKPGTLPLLFPVLHPEGSVRPLVGFEAARLERLLTNLADNSLG